MLKLGNKTVKGAKLGSHNILKVYRGSNLYADFTGGGGGNNEYYSKPLTVEALGDGTLTFADHVPTDNLYVRINGGDSQIMTSSNKSVTVSKGDKIEMFCTSNSTYSFSSTAIIRTDFQFNLYGNINSMYYGDDFIGKEDDGMPGANMCYFWFYSAKVVDASNLILPHKTLADYCYQSMFSSCTSLTKAPKLPATELAQYCYGSMFYYCKLLTVAPKLPATKLVQYCYTSMFSSCESLTTAPQLPATELASGCYGYMFSNCTAFVNPPKLPATKLVQYCYYYMFNGCTALTTAPELPATELVQNCYQCMFQNCSSLNYIKCLAEKNIAYNLSTSKWVNGVPKTGTFVKKRGVEWSFSLDHIPSGWTVQEVD